MTVSNPMQILLIVVLLASYSNLCIGKAVVVLITGCSSGIGYSTALAFAKNDTFKVYATMRSASRWVDPPSGRPDNLIVAEMDVTSDESVGDMVNEIIAAEGGLDVVVNNAGYGVAGCFETVSMDEAKAVFEVNVWGVVRVLQAVLPHMRIARSGHIINISSTSGIRGIPCAEFYTGSKFALEGITDSMRYSLSMYNVSVTNVNAGPVKTAFTDRFGDSSVGGRGTRRSKDDNALILYTEKMVSTLNERMKSPEVQTADEVGHVVLGVAMLRLNSKSITEVPFNLATSAASQKILDGVRVRPTGWGGIYTDLLSAVPTLESLNEQQRSEL